MQSTTDQITIVQNTIVQSTTDQSTIVQSTTDQSTIIQSTIVQSTTFQSTDLQSATSANRTPDHRYMVTFSPDNTTRPSGWGTLNSGQLSYYLIKAVYGVPSNEQCKAAYTWDNILIFQYLNPKLTIPANQAASSDP